MARLAGSTLCVGVPGSVASDELCHELRALGPGGIVVFSRNVTSLEATRAFIAAVRAAAGGDLPALVCVDQEGGRVARLPYADLGMPSMMALGAANDAALAERAGVELAREVVAVGANVNFSPVLDLALAPAGTVIGTRSLGTDPERVAALGAALVRGLQSGGVAATAKHFPGHGATSLDSHVASPASATPAATLRTRELLPFRAALRAGARAVMTAHVIVEALDAARPATLSRAVLTDLLRGELGFEGVCFTDCLQMAAIAGGVGSARGAALALAAGADMAIVSHDLRVARQARDAIVAAVESGDLPLWRLAEAAQRTARLRSRLQLPPGEAPAAEGPGEPAREIARRAIAVLRGDPRLRPERPVTVVSFEGAASDGVASSAGPRPSLSLALRRRRLRSELMRVDLEPDDDAIAVLIDVLRGLGERNVVVLARRAHLHAGQRRALAVLFDAVPGAIAVSALEPFDVAALTQAQTVVCTFGDEAANVEALADRLCAAVTAP